MVRGKSAFLLSFDAGYLRRKPWTVLTASVMGLDPRHIVRQRIYSITTSLVVGKQREQISRGDEIDLWEP